MDRNAQFCTKEQALRLVELGVKPQALFWHSQAKSGPHGEHIQYGWTSEAIAPAYSVAELGDMLPEWVRNEKDKRWSVVRSTKWEGRYSIETESVSHARLFGISGCTEADVRSEMLIYLLENYLMDLPEPWRQDPNDAAEVWKVQRAKEAI